MQGGELVWCKTNARMSKADLYCMLAASSLGIVRLHCDKFVIGNASQYCTSGIW